MTRPWIIILPAALLCTSAAHAAAPTVDAVKAAIAAENTGSDLDAFRVVATGPIGPLHNGAVVAAYTTIISGGNMRAQTFGIFVEQDGKAVRLPTNPEPTGQVDRVTVAGPHVLVHWMSYKPRDPQCCPSQPHHITYTVHQAAVTG